MELWRTNRWKKIGGVCAINNRTLTVTGAGLDKLKAEDITVEGNVVSSVVASADSKTATVNLTSDLAPDTDTKVSVKVGEETKEYTVKFGIDAKAVAIQTGTYDDDTKGQRLVVLVDGVATSIDYLLSSGYSVTFNAYDKDGVDANTTLFGAATSESGKLDGVAPITAGDYQVQVVIAKGSTVLTSEKSSITIRNLDSSATAISSYKMTNYGVDKATAGGDDFEQTSTSLVVGEKGIFSQVVIGAGSTKAEILPGSFELKSSDESIVSVDSATGEVTAEGLGTAKVTITVGTATKEVTLTVAGTTRKATKATPSASTAKTIIGGTSTLKTKITDQYGDPIVGVSGVSAHFPTSITTWTVAGPTALTTDAKGEVNVALGVNAGSAAGQTGTVLLKDADNKVLGSFAVTTTSVDNATTQRIAYDATSESKDDSIDAELLSDDTITYKISKYTSENVFNGDVADLAGYVVKFNGDIISVSSDAGTTDVTTGDYTVLAGGNGKLLVKIKGAGTTTLAIYKPDGTLVGTKTITVTKGSNKIASVAWKSAPTIDYTTTINYKTVLDITEAAAGVDDIVKGITLSSPTVNKIRIAGKAAGGTLADGDIYIDKNDDGISDGGDVLIGKLSLAATASSTGSIAGVTGVDGFTGTPVTVGAAAKGNIVFSITDETSSDTPKPVVATKGVAVDVK